VLDAIDEVVPPDEEVAAVDCVCVDPDWSGELPHALAIRAATTHFTLLASFALSKIP
jgi:hypothetical protein